MIIDSVEEIIRHKNLEKYQFFDMDKYHELLEKHEQYYMLNESEEPRLQTLFNHLNRVLGDKTAHITEVVGNYNTFKILIGVKQDQEKARVLEILIQNAKTSEIICLFHVFRALERETPEKKSKTGKISSKEFFGRITIYGNEIDNIVTNEFGLKFLNGLISTIFTNRGLPDLNIEL